VHVNDHQQEEQEPGDRHDVFFPLVKNGKRERAGSSRDP
jgi:hypothetical protein